MNELCKKAFMDVLHEKIKEEPPDYEWITRLYDEIKQKLLKLLQSGSTLHNEINEKLDTKLFHQMITHNVFDGSDFHILISYVFDMCLRLGSPQRDEFTKKKKEEVLQILEKGNIFSDIIVSFIQNANICIDAIYEDIHLLYTGDKSSDTL